MRRCGRSIDCFMRNLYDPSLTRSPTSSREHCHHLEHDGKVEEKEGIASGIEQIAAIREETKDLIGKINDELILHTSAQCKQYSALGSMAEDFATQQMLLTLKMIRDTEDLEKNDGKNIKKNYDAALVELQEERERIAETLVDYRSGLNDPTRLLLNK